MDWLLVYYYYTNTSQMVLIMRQIHACMNDLNMCMFISNIDWLVKYMYMYHEYRYINYELTTDTI